MTKDVESAPEFSAKDYHDPPPAPLLDFDELTKWSFYRALIAEFIATLLFLYATAGISGGHINPAVTFRLFLGRKVSLIRAVMYMVAQSLGAICGVGLVKAFQKSFYNKYGGGANELADGYNEGTGLGAGSRICVTVQGWGCSGLR